jgi:FlaA1/EpsC-like NDP-sugar epimerase
MNFTNIKCISEKCKDKNITMGGAGGSFGGRISIAKVRCPNCDLTLMIVPMSEKYEYGITATTEEERKEERIKKAKEQSELELAKTINRINEIGY